MCRARTDVEMHQSCAHTERTRRRKSRFPVRWRHEAGEHEKVKSDGVAGNRSHYVGRVDWRRARSRARSGRRSGGKFCSALVLACTRRSARRCEPVRVPWNMYNFVAPIPPHWSSGSHARGSRGEGCAVRLRVPVQVSCLLANAGANAVRLVLDPRRPSGPPHQCGGMGDTKLYIFR